MIINRKIKRTYFSSFNRTITFVFIVLIFGSIEIYSFWDKITTIPPPFDRSKGWLEFWFLKDNPDYGWVCGFDGMVIRTTDRGKTWSGTIIPGADQLESITFVDTKVGYTSGTTVWGYGAIYKSVDGGATWREVTDPRRRAILWGNHFLDADNGIVIGGGCGYPQQFFRTRDGGRTWSLYETYPDVLTSMSDVILYPDGQGYAVSSGLLWETANSGYNWRIIAQTGRNDWQEDMHIKGRTILLPYSDGCDGNMLDGGVRVSTNFGLNWKETQTGYPMFGGWLMDDRQGWVCGHGSTLLYTPDAGDSWESRNCGIDPREVLDDFWFIDDTTGFVCGLNVYRYAPPKNVYSKILASSINACEGDTIVLASDGSFFHYQWSTGETDSAIVVTKSGTYELVCWNTVCDTLHPAVVNIDFNPKPDLTLSIDNGPVICEGDSVIIRVQTNANSILWTTGETSDSIVVKVSGTYKVIVENEYNCSREEEIFIQVVPLPKPELVLDGRERFCVGDSAVILATPGYDYYIWYDGKGNETRTKENYLKVGNSGDYYCIAVNKEGCEGGGADTISIEVIDDINRIAFAFPVDREFDMDSTYFPDRVCKAMILRNNTDKDWYIYHPFLYGNVSFSFPLSQFPIKLASLDSVEMRVCYSPSKLGVERDTMIIDDVCNPHYLVLKGLSIANVFESTSICDEDVSGTTVSLPGKYVFSTLPPFPNPAGSYVNIPFSFRDEKGLFTGERAVLYDIRGDAVLNSELTISTKEDLNGFILTTGEFSFDIRELPAGLYMIVINTRAGIIRYNQIIIRD